MVLLILVLIIIAIICFFWLISILSSNRDQNGTVKSQTGFYSNAKSDVTRTIVLNDLPFGNEESQLEKISGNERNAILNKYGINSLWYITTIENLKSILFHGILCRNVCQERKLGFADISDLSIQKRRTEFHSYVPLFFAHNTPMLYRVVKEKGEEIVLLEINRGIMLARGVKFSDGNIASGETQIFDNLDDLEQLNWKVIYRPSGPLYRDWKRIRSAEVLVPNQVDSSKIISIHVQTDQSIKKVRDIFNGLKMKVKVIKDLTREGIIKEVD